MPERHLGGLFEDLDEWKPPRVDGESTALATGLMALDANVVLDLYRFGAVARGDLLGVLRSTASTRSRACSSGRRSVSQEKRSSVTQQAPSTSASAIAARGVWPDTDPLAGALLATCAPGSVVQSLAPLLRLPLGALPHPSHCADGCTRRGRDRHRNAA
jgi:hypothetical protein